MAKLPHETVNFGGIWHSDTVYLEQPPMATMLLARELPPYGGDTMFASMYAAYDALSPALREMLDGLQAVNSSALADVSKTREDRIRDHGSNEEEQQFLATHPVVRTHPETGRKALYVNRGAHGVVRGDDRGGERPLLEFLFRHSTRPEFTCRFQWEAGFARLVGQPLPRCTIPINDYHGFTRRMHRITLGRRHPRADGAAPDGARLIPHPC